VSITGFTCRVRFYFEECFRCCCDPVVVDCFLSRREVKGVEVWNDCKFCLLRGAVCGDVIDVGGDVGFSLPYP